MTLATKHATQVAWRTKAENVYQLTRTYPKTYRISVSAIDTNEIGANQTDVGYYFIDWFGRPYSVISTATGTIDVSDDFDTNRCPYSGNNGIVFKSDWKGRSLYLMPENFRHLHPQAFQNAQAWFNKLLWANDPNSKRIAISSTDEPKLTNYQSVQSDGFILAEDYGEYPKVKLFQADGSNIIERSERPYFIYSAGLIDTITFGVLDQTSDWIIEISK